MGVLVSSGCYNKNNRWSGLNTRNIFLTILVSEMSMMMVVSVVVRVEGLLPGLQTATFFLYPHMAESDHVFCVSSLFNFLFFGYTAQLVGFQFSD